MPSWLDSSLCRHSLGEWARKRPSRTLRWGASLLLVAVVVAGLVTATMRMATLTAPLVSEDNRSAARAWIDANLPPGTVIALEAYTPYLDPAHYELRVLGRLIDQPPEWYVIEGVEVVIAARQMYGRFYADPVRYATEVTAYDHLFDLFPQAQRFGEDGLEIRVHRVTAP